MKSLLKATSQMELEQIFLDIEKSEENGIEGILLNFCFFLNQISKFFLLFFVF